MRYLFMIVNGIIIIAGIVCFILGNINFNEKWYYSGSFIGGQLASVSILFVVYGCLGLYAAFKQDSIATMIYGTIAAVSLITRILLWALAAMHKYYLPAWYYGYVALELTIIILSAALFYVIR